MKIRQILSLFVYVVSITMVIGQTPEGFNYQAVARNADGTLLTGTNVEVVFSLHAGTENGTIIWEETHDLTTSAVGSFSVVIGGDPLKRTGGTAAIFSGIDWSANLHFLEISIDDVSMGSSQLMSVPYASLAKNVINSPESAWTMVNGNLVLDAGNVAIGSETANSKLTIQGDLGAHVDTALFEVKNVNGDPVFAVYNEGVRIYIEDTNLKGIKGGFAVGGYNTATKGFTNEFLRVTPDSVRIWVNEPTGKGVKGGFAVGGYKKTKDAIPTSFMQLDPENYFIGHEAGLRNERGEFNSFFGYQAGRSNIDGNQNIFIGYNSGFSNTSGRLNTFVGNRTGYSNTSGFANVFIGDSSGYYNEDGQWNVFVGEGTGIRNTSGWSNVFLGDKAGRDNVDGGKNVFIGSIAGWKNIDGYNNVFIGTAAGARNISGADNTFLGSGVGRFNSEGNTNIFIGKSAGYNNTRGSDNIYIGAGAGLLNDSTYSNIFIGNNSGEKNTAGYGNVYLGNRTGSDIVDGSNNTILGHESAHFKTSGEGNTYLGAYSGHRNTIGTNNTFLGANSGHHLTEGHSNTVIGEAAGFNMKGSGNVFIGTWAGRNEQGSGKLYIDNSDADSTWALVYGDFNQDLLTINGKLGINTTDPLNHLHVSSYENYAKFMVGQRDSIVGFGEFAGSKSGAPGGSIRLGIGADYDDTEEFWQVSVWEDNFQIGTQSNFAWFEISSTGMISHRGSELHADFVFKDDYKLESIEEHASFMWSNSHLPAVPKAKVDENGMDVVDLGARNKGVLEELEKAHIYIEQLNTALKEQQAMILELKQEMEILKTEK